MRPRHTTSLLLLSLLLVTCASPTATPQRLPTRAAAPTPTTTPFRIPAQSYYEHGLALRNAGDMKGALQAFSSAIEQAPDFAQAYVARGTVYLAQERLGWALADADAALKVEPISSEAYILRGETLQRLGRPQEALEAFDQAVSLNPSLKPDIFRSRWSAARTAGNDRRMLELSRDYAQAHPDDPLQYYYRAWAFIALDMPAVAANMLIEGIEATSIPPALLWFALGQAYAMNESWQEAITSLEAARTLVQAGDTTLGLHSDRPIADLFGTLGRAYVKAGRCADGEAMLEYALSVGAPTSEYATALREASICLTPTPTATPYPTITPSAW